ncbi:uncharacterized protein LOC105181087 [Harpegnathos saltator]|uniref:uncharacterized protein LOC105181087 n=1 Tax=Harpegnathos saltator TaxID=610380 RepID=UPI00058B627C|nr:uncharacterized protein LOC105181087 [Harpegnathos saltator]
MVLSVTPNGLRLGSVKGPRRTKWAISQLDREVLEISLAAFTWPSPEEGQDLDFAVAELMGIVTKACDAAMPKVRYYPKRSAWWWSEEIADLRRISLHLRRSYRRTRNDEDSDPKAVLAAHIEYRRVFMALRDAIGAARGKGWNTFL